MGVAVIDTGIAGDLPDFRVSADRHALARHRLRRRQPGRHHGERHATATARTSPASSPATPTAATLGDPQKGRFSGVAPDANLVSIKVSDDEGNATVLDVIAGIQFAVDHKAEYNIRVLNLSLESTVAESYKTDPLDAAVEAAWFEGIFVVAAAGNRGPGGDAVHYAPGNDPYIVTVGAVDDQGTEGDRRRRAGELVEPRHDAGRLRQARHLRAGRQDRLEPRAGQSQYADAVRRRASASDGEYIRAGGTSMAAPMVAGAAAIGFQLDADA